MSCLGHTDFVTRAGPGSASTWSRAGVGTRVFSGTCCKTLWPYGVPEDKAMPGSFGQELEGEHLGSAGTVSDMCNRSLVNNTQIYLPPRLSPWLSTPKQN